jgi:hypothetical protein
MHKALRAALLALFLLGAAAHAAVVTHADVNGLATFQDTNTGLVWVGLGNFFNMGYPDMESIVTAAGFTVADATQVHGLLDTLPLDAGQWPSYRAIMGGAPVRELIWGAYLPTSPNLNWAYAYSTDGVWSFDEATGVPLGVIPNADTPIADMNIWAFRTDSAVPEPAYTVLLGVLGAAACFLRRRA